MNINHLLSSRTPSEISFILCELSQKQPSSVTKDCRNLLFYVRIPSETFYHLWHFPWETSYVRFSMRTSIFLAQFISECHSLCQIQLTLHFFVRVHLRICVFFSEPPSFYKISTSYFQWDFTSKASTFCQILIQKLLDSVIFCIKITFLQWNFTTEVPSFGQIFTLKTASFFQILLQKLLICFRFYHRTS